MSCKQGKGALPGNDYLEREAVRLAIFNTRWRNFQDVDIAYDMVKSIAAADAAPVVHGQWAWREEWETHPETRSCDLISCGWYCTACGIELGEYLSKGTGQHICLDDDSVKPRLAACPHCRALMDGGK